MSDSAKLPIRADPTPILLPSDRGMSGKSANGKVRATFDIGEEEQPTRKSNAAMFSMSGTDVVNYLDPRRSSGSNGQASISSSVINLANAILGVGLLALPRSFSQAGFGIGLLLLAFVFALSTLTCHMLTQSAGVVGRPCSMRAVSDAAYPLFSLFVDSAVCINNVGAGCSYVVVATDGFATVFTGGSHRPVWVIVTIAIVTPLCFLKTLDALRHTSLAAVVILVFITFVTIAYASHEGSTDPGDILSPCPRGTDSASCPPGEVEAVGDGAQVIRAFSGLALAFTCQAQVMPVWNEIVLQRESNPQSPGPARLAY